MLFGLSNSRVNRIDLRLFPDYTISYDTLADLIDNYCILFIDDIAIIDQVSWEWKEAKVQRGYSEDIYLTLWPEFPSKLGINNGWVTKEGVCELNGHKGNKGKTKETKDVPKGGDLR